MAQRNAYTLAAGFTVSLAALMVASSAPAKPVSRATVTGLVKKAAACKVPHATRCEAMRSLVALGPDAATHLVKALGDRAPERRAVAAAALGQVGTHAQAKALLPLLGDAAPKVRLAAIGAVGKLRPPGATAALLESLGRESVVEKATAAAALGQTGALAAVGPLQQHLAHHHPRVRSAAARALGAIGDPTVAGDLEALLEDAKTPPLVVKAAIEALTRLRLERSVEPIARVVGSRDEKLRMAAIEALGALGYARGIVALDPLLSEGGEPARAALDAIGQIGSTDALAAVVRLIKEPSTERTVLRKAFWAVGSIGSPIAGPAVVPLLRHKDAEIATWAAEALGRIKHTDATRELIDALEREEVSVKQMAAWALAEIYGQNLGDDPQRWWQWISAAEERAAGEAE